MSASGESVDAYLQQWAPRSPSVRLAMREDLEQLLGAIPREELIAALLATYPEQSRSQAVLDVAEAAEVAVFWQDRETIGATLGVRFTDDEWDAVQSELGNFDEWIGNGAYGVADTVRDWMTDCVRAAGLDLAALKERTGEEDAEADWEVRTGA